MSFFKALFSLFAGEEKPKNQAKQENPLALPEHASRQIAENKKQPCQQAAKDTLKLVNMPDEIKQQIIDAFDEADLNARNPVSFCAEKIGPQLKSIDWNWVEWDYWSKKVVELNLCPANMPWPLPDVLNFECERKKYSPDKVFNVCTLKVAKERLQDFPETASMKKTEVVEFLKENSDAWHAVIDPHIEKIWNNKKHYEGATPELILVCLLDTIYRRGICLYNIQRMTRARGIPHEEFSFDEDRKLFDIARNDPKTPWKKKYGHPVPGGDLWYQFEFEPSIYEKSPT